MKLLLIDDESSLLRHRQKFLTERGCEVDIAQNGADAIALLSETQYSGIVLDVMLEETSGFQLCRKIKAITGAPVIFLSNLSDEETQKQGFLCGGDDYINKLCGLDLFWLKLQKRINISSSDVGSTRLTFGPLTIDIRKRLVDLQEQDVPLTNLEFDILLLIASAPLKVWSINEIYVQIWGAETLNQVQTVQVHISRLRGKLEKAFSRHCFLQTVWGKGYRFVPISLDEFSA